MKKVADWSWNLREAIDQIKTRYEHIGRKTGAPFLAVVYPPQAETAVLKEWRTLIGTLGADFDVKSIDVLKVTMAVIDELSSENILNSISNPMPGSNPESELGHMWVSAVASAVKEVAAKKEEKKLVIVLQHLLARQTFLEQLHRRPDIDALDKN